MVSASRIKTVMFNKKLIGVFSFIIFGFILFFARGSANAATFTVTNTNDSGAGSLRQAIIDSNANANSPTVDVIEFNIPGTGEHVITHVLSFDDIVEPVSINGYSQPGSSANTAASPEPLNGTITIVIDGTGPTSGNGLIFESGSAGSSLRGVSLYGHPADGSTQGLITVRDDNVTIAGNYIGVTSSGLAQPSVDFDTRNQTAILSDSGTSSLTIGGTNPEDRNVVAGTSSGVGATSFKSTNTLVYGNYFCVGKDGTTDLGCVLGVSTSGGSATYGGTASGMRNVMSGGSLVNVLLLSSSTSVVQGNYIGTDYTGKRNSSITNGSSVVANAGAAGNLIGGTSAGEGNVIIGNGSGIAIAQFTIDAFGPLDLISNKNAILGNSIYSIKVFNYPGFGTSNLGIDHFIQTDTDAVADFIPDVFENQGVTANDVGDADNGPNGFINSPVLKTAVQNGTTLTIKYDLDADDAEEPADQYRVEFFANNTASIFGFGPGEIYLGSATVSPGTDQTANLTVSGDYTNKALSATTTAIDSTVTSTGGFGSTSEFSGNISIGSITDFDADGAPDALEDLAPNNGDGNNDGTPDKIQPRVTSFLDYDSRYWVTFITEGCNENAAVMSIDAASLPSKDNGYEYIYGMTDFTLNCSKAETVNVTKYIHDPDTDISKFLPRKYNPNTGVFAGLTGATLARETVGTSSAIKLAYSITDGGTFDDDGEENGIIVDPVGLASESAASAGLLANTGIVTALAIPVGFFLILSATYTYVDYRKHKKPLVEANPKRAETYTYWHHIKVVSIPLARYRVRILLERKEFATSK